MTCCPLYKGTCHGQGCTLGHMSSSNPWCPFCHPWYLCKVDCKPLEGSTHLCQYMSWCHSSSGQGGRYTRVQQAFGHNHWNNQILCLHNHPDHNRVPHPCLQDNHFVHHRCSHMECMSHWTIQIPQDLDTARFHPYTGA